MNPESFSVHEPAPEEGHHEEAETKTEKSDFLKPLKKLAAFASIAAVTHFAGVGEAVGADFEKGAPNKDGVSSSEKMESMRISDKYRGMKNVVLTTEEYARLREELPKTQGVGVIKEPFHYSCVMLKPGERLQDYFKGIGASIYKEYDSSVRWTKDLMGKK
ncbi:MAG: hypothetical protein WCO79_03115 [bacterium]